MHDAMTKKHWYDGWFYAWFVDTGLISLRSHLDRYIEDGKRVIDIGCGTGGFALKLAPRSQEVLGVDISQLQIRQANKRIAEAGLSNIRFVAMDASGLSELIDDPFDYAVMTLMLHEINPLKRVELLQQAGRVAKKVIILDYHVPLAWNFWGTGIRVIEYFTSREHFGNFNEFRRRGGLAALAGEAGFQIESRKVNRQRIFTTFVLRSPAVA
jgi:SAM-dependent methyltransferase